MTLPTNPADQADSPDELLASILGELATKVGQGEQVEIDPYIRAHPECEERLRELLPTIEVLADLGQLGLQLNEGKLAEINDYCRCDVLDTYFVFLRTSVLMGRISLDREREIVTETKQWITDRADQVLAYRTYLDNWGNWQNPWIEAAPEED